MRNHEGNSSAMCYEVPGYASMLSEYHGVDYYAINRVDPDKSNGHNKVHKWDAQNVCFRLAKGLYEPYQSILSIPHSFTSNEQSPTKTSLCTSRFTIYLLALPTPLPSIINPPTNSKMAQDVGIVEKYCCHSNLRWLVFEGSILYGLVFVQKNFLWLYK